MVDDSLDQERQQKTLGLSSKKLGLKFPATKKLPVKNFASTRNKETVVVVVKTKSTKGINQNNNVNKLTAQEKQNRVNALLQAEKDNLLASSKKEEIFSDTKNISDDHLYDTSNKAGNDEISNSDPIHDEKTLQPVQDIKSPVSKGHKTKESADKFTKGQADDEEEKTGNKKKILDNIKSVKKVSLTQVFKLEQEDSVIETKIRTIKRVSKNKHKDVKGQKQAKIYREVKIPDRISVQELASRMSEKVALVLKVLMSLGINTTINDYIDADTAELVVQELGHTPIRVTDVEIEKSLFQDSSDAPLEPRPPIVTIMGHVDHGKTSLLDALRLTDIVAKEHGGITQHIGAYKVSLGQEQSITFLDTPGHEAFTTMRMRGVKITDIVIIVVAADDGIKEQTIEAINHAKAAEVPIIVAINKIDKPTADIQKVKNSLPTHGLVPEDIGGDVIVIPVSAQEKRGLAELEEAILIQAEMLDLKTNYTGRVEGVVIESKIDKMRGTLATLLVQRGTLKVGDITVVKDQYFKVRALIDDKGDKVTSAVPSTPVEGLGLGQTAKAGEKFLVVANEKLAKKIIEFQAYKENKNNNKENKISFDTLLKQQSDSVLKNLNIIIKADVHGSLEAINAMLQKLSNEEVIIKIVHAAVGSITEPDISLAKVTDAVVLGFNVSADNKAKKTASNLGIEIKYYSVIYDLVDDVKALVTGLTEPIQKEKIIGYAEVRQVINLTKNAKVAGCMVTEGIIKKKAYARLLRNDVVIHDGKLSSLKRFKDNVQEVRSGFDCGLLFENFNDFKENDRLEAYELIEES